VGHWRTLVVALVVGLSATVPFAGAAGQSHRASATASYPYVGVADARPKATVGVFPNISAAGGDTQPNVWTHELRDALIVPGDQPVENPSPAIGSKPAIKLFSFLDDGPEVPTTITGDSSSGYQLGPFATHTSPDKMVYLVLSGQHGADPAYDYGTHFLFVAHEWPSIGFGGNGNPAAAGIRGTIMRVNLDADFAHRVTIVADRDASGHALPGFDGITWDPFRRKLLASPEERSPDGGVWSFNVDGSDPHNESAYFGASSYEGMQIAPDGSMIIAEDDGGGKGVANPHAKAPMDYLYRWVPNDRSSLASGGRLQALQVLADDGTPIAPRGATRSDGANNDPVITDIGLRSLHNYGRTFSARWITCQVVPAGGMPSSYDANAACYNAFATPFRRPENAVYRPGTQFQEIWFSDTGDTDRRSEANPYGGYGSIFRFVTTNSADGAGSFNMVFLGDQDHSGFDNVAWWDKDHVVFEEDAGNTLHTQTGHFDSMWMFDANADYGVAGNKPLRLLAAGRDPIAALSQTLGKYGLSDDENELTGITVSDGDPSPGGLLGARLPHPFHGGWHVFYTLQHGQGNLYEVEPNPWAQGS
jgi:Alkaline phosphatase PhoX